MNNEEAIKFIKEQMIFPQVSTEWEIKHNDVLELAIEALKDDIYGKCNGCVNDECESCCRWDKHADCYESEVTV